MALFLSDRLTSASGSVGGTTYSHNRFGLYTKARRKGVNPNTPAQQAQRSAFAGASAGWRALTQVQRDAWSAYAAATPVKNALGMTVFLTGAQQYTASNSFLGRLGEPAVAAGPTTPGRIDLGTPTIDITAATGGSVEVDSLPLTPATLLVSVFVGNPVSAGVLFFNGPYQLITTDTPTAGSINVTPIVGRNGLPFVVAQKIPFRITGVDTASGRLTTVVSGIAVVA